MITEILTENKGIVRVHSKFMPSVSDYTVYKNRVYRVVGSSGNHKNLSLTLESTVNNKRFVVKNPEVMELREVVYPTGYMEV